MAGVCTITTPPPPTACVSATGFKAAVRASRRGQARTNFSSTGAPSGNGWGEAYDTDNNLYNFGIWTDVPSLPVKNSAAVASPAYTGNPATELYPNPSAPAATPLLQINDPTSPPTPMTDWGSGFHQTSMIQMGTIFGPFGIRTGGGPLPAFWDATVVAGPYMNYFGVSSGTYLQSSQFFPLNPVTPIPPLPGPPQPCTSDIKFSNTPPCDTDQNTYLAGGYLYDSYTPYLMLNITGGWTLLTGTVQDSATGNGIPGVAVRISPGSGAFPFNPFEKVTYASGAFSVLVPGASGNLVLSVNDPNPVAPNTPDTHYYDPWHSSTTLTVPVTWDMSNPGTSNTPNIGTISLNSVFPNLGGNGTVSGIVTAAENNTVVLPGITVALRDSQGGILQSVQTDLTGTYTFSNLAVGPYFVTPVLGAGQASTPTKATAVVSSGPNPTQNFTISGVKATIIASAGQPGVVVMVVPGAGGGSLTTPPLYIQNATPNYIKVTGDDGTATLQVPASAGYTAYCWRPNAQGAFNYSNPVNPSTLTNLDPTQALSFACP